MGPEDEALDELYLGDFDEFVGKRDALARELRAQGDADAAERVRALKKPSRAAWAVNRLGGRERDQLLEAAGELRRVQERVLAGEAEGADLRAVSERERAAVDGALEAVARDAQLSPAALKRA